MNSMMVIKVTYQYPSAAGKPIVGSYLCISKEQADRICKEVEKRKDKGYKLLDVTREE